MLPTGAGLPAGASKHPPASHAHLWFLADGTGLHAPAGQLVVDEATGRLCCHLCGRWFRSLGSHVRAHGWSAADYRRAMGLCSTAALTSSEVSSSIAVRQSARYAADPEHRQDLAHGQQMARTGALTARSVAGRALAPEPAQRTVSRSAALQTGRRTRSARLAADLAARVARLGAADLHGHLRTRYAAGASLESLARETGLGREALSAALRDAGVRVRAPGQNTRDGRRSRALSNDASVAARVGTADLPGWLRRRTGEGASLSALARETGRSTHWVRWRLQDRAEQRTG